MKPKLLCILHRAPPAHGAAKVGDFIASSKKLNASFDCRFITIKSSDTIGDIGKINFKKIYFVVELYVKVLWALIAFRPQKIYFTASIRSVALYRDLLVSTLWKLYKTCTPTDEYYHYHTKGVNEFVSRSNRNLSLTRFFINNVNLLLLSPLLEKDFDKVKSYKQIYFLPNGVEDNVLDEKFEKYLHLKYKQVETIEVLYLAHMLKEKGYWDVLELARDSREKNIRFHFAGSWKNEESKSEFFDFVKEHNLEQQIIHHGFVSGDKKASLFKQAHILLYPSKNDAFPLTLLESLSFGVPVIATDEGSIPYILDKKSGIILGNISELAKVLDQAKVKLISKETAIYCRERFLRNFSLEQFEENLVKILKRKG